MLKRKRKVLTNTADNFDPDQLPSLANAVAEIAKEIAPIRATVQRLSNITPAYSHCIYAVSGSNNLNTALKKAEAFARCGGPVVIVPKKVPTDRIERAIFRNKYPRSKGFSCDNVGTAFRLYNAFEAE